MFQLVLYFSVKSITFHKSRPNINMNMEPNPSQQVVVVDPSTPLPQPNLFKLNIDCFEALFEYLGIKELHSFASTCKIMQKLAGEYFKRNFFKCGSVIKQANDIQICPHRPSTIFGLRIPADHSHMRFGIPCFNQYIKHVLISGDGAAHGQYFIYHNKVPESYNFDALQAIESNVSESSIIRISFEKVNFHFVDIKRIQNILAKVETICVEGKCMYNCDFHEFFLKYCSNLKRFDVRGDLTRDVRTGRRQKVPCNRRECFRDCGHGWMRQNYPKLEQLTLRPKANPQVHGLGDFFNRHPNIRCFSTTSILLFCNSHQLLQCNAELDVLAIKKYGPMYNVSAGSLPMIFNIIKKLHERGFYKRLHFDIGENNENAYKQLALLPGLEKCYYRRYYPVQPVSNLIHLANLKELAIEVATTSNEFDILVNTLSNLECVYLLYQNSADCVLPFIRRLPNLKKLRVSIISPETNGNLKLTFLNEEREKLLRARKVIIYADEGVFLKTKWNTLNGDINLSLVQMKTYDLYQWDSIELD